MADTTKQFKIEKGIPLPERARSTVYTPYRELMKRMKPGDSVLFPSFREVAQFQHVVRKEYPDYRVVSRKEGTRTMGPTSRRCWLTLREEEE